MEDPRISLVVEWDNARYREIERARRMLRGVVAQLTELDEQAEVLVVYDGLVVEDVVVKTVVEEARRMAPNRVEFLSICAPGSRYYQLKNVGARRAHGTILVFVDSDVLPEAGWLPALLGPFDDPNIEAVIANTYVDTDTIYGKIFALCWYFPLRQLDGPLVPTTSSFVNSLAVRRSMFERHPFPEGRKLYIGQCLNHFGTLRDNGVAVYLNPRARVAHPPPTFVRSAIINGHDAVVRASSMGHEREPARASYWRWRANLGAACRRILVDHRQVQLPRLALPIALITAVSYYSLWCLAELLTRAIPRVVEKLYDL